MLSNALDYTNVKSLFIEDASDPQTAKDSLHLLEMIMLMLERWVSSLNTDYEDEFMFALVVSLLEVLVHAAAFWARLKQSEVLTSMVIRVQDAERSPDSLLKRKCLAIMKSIASEKHQRIPDPVDRLRFRSKEASAGSGSGNQVHLP